MAEELWTRTWSANLGKRARTIVLVGDRHTRWDTHVLRQKQILYEIRLDRWYGIPNQCVCGAVGGSRHDHFGARRLT